MNKTAMTACENNLFIQAGSVEKRDYILQILNDGIKLFESLVPLSGTKDECYGTESDVYIEYITMELTNCNMIRLQFFTHDLPPILFCKKLCAFYGLNIQLVYYNQEKDFSGKYHIYSNQVVKNDYFSYWQGLYTYDLDTFWERIPEVFDHVSSFLDLLYKLKLSVIGKHFNELNDIFNKYMLFKQFEKL